MRRSGLRAAPLQVMGRLQGKKRLLEQSNRADFQLDDGPVDGNALANKSKLALVLQDAGDLVEARLLHEEVRALVYQLLPEAAVSHSDRNERDSACNCWSFLLTRWRGDLVRVARCCVDVDVDDDDDAAGDRCADGSARGKAHGHPAGMYTARADLPLRVHKCLPDVYRS